MFWFEKMQQAIDYMEDHLLEEINYEDVATQVHMSAYEFHRAFSFFAGFTANEYIRNRRLSLAGRELQEKKAKVIDVALKYGYDSPDGFTKAFTKFHGVSPKNAALDGVSLTLFAPLSITLALKGGERVNYRIEQQEEKYFLARVQDFAVDIIHDDSNHEIPDFWEMCGKKGYITELTSLCSEGKKDLYGLCAPLIKNQTSFAYGIGVLLEGEPDELVLQNWQQKGFTLWKTNPCRYVVFSCIGEDGDCITQAWEKFYREFLPQSGYEPSEETDFEIYFEKEQGMFCELWIPIFLH